MARPKLPNLEKKEKLNLTVSREVKEMLDLIRIEKNISISAFLEEAVMKEYRKLQKAEKAEKAEKVEEPQLAGQMNLTDLETKAKLEKELAYMNNEKESL